MTTQAPCRRCGTALRVAARFCSQCGTGGSPEQISGATLSGQATSVVLLVAAGFVVARLVVSAADASRLLDFFLTADGGSRSVPGHLWLLAVWTAAAAGSGLAGWALAAAAQRGRGGGRVGIGIGIMLIAAAIASAVAASGPSTLLFPVPGFGGE